MSDKKTITLALMDPPFENARTTTALRIADILAKRGFNINVWAYEGAVHVPSTRQTAHANKVHGMDANESPRNVLNEGDVELAINIALVLWQMKVYGNYDGNVVEAHRL